MQYHLTSWLMPCFATFFYALANNQVFAQDGQTLPPGGAADGSVGTGFVLPGIVVCLLMAAALYAVCRSSHRV